MENKEGLTIYNSKKIYNDEILPLINQIKIICAKNNLPFFCTCPVVNSEEETKYETDGYFTGSSGINLKKDHIINMIKVLRGVELKPVGRVQLDADAIDYISSAFEPEQPVSLNTTNSGWYTLFKENIYANIDDRAYKTLFPELKIDNVSIKVIIGALLLKEIFNISDDELINNITFNPQYREALEITDVRPCVETLNRFRVICSNSAIMRGNDIIYDTITGLSMPLTKFGYNSEQIANNIKNYTVFRMLYINIKKICEYLTTVCTDVVLNSSLDKYLSQSSYMNDVLLCIPKNVENGLKRTVNDSEILINEYSDKIFDLPEFQNMFNIVVNTRNIKHLENSNEADDYEVVSPVTNNTISDVVNPEDFDDDVIENILEEQNDEIVNNDEPVRQIIEDKPKEKTVIYKPDGTKEKFVGRKPNDIILKFDIDKASDSITKCPAGNKPLKSHYDIKLKKYLTTMRKEDCESCPYRDDCKAKIHRRVANIAFSKKSIQRLLR